MDRGPCTECQCRQDVYQKFMQEDGFLKVCTLTRSHAASAMKFVQLLPSMRKLESHHCLSVERDSKTSDQMPT